MEAPEASIGQIIQARWQRILAVYPASFLQGLTVTLYPAAGNLLTDPTQHGLSEAQFGSLFAPQLVAAIVASSLASRIAGRTSMKSLLLLGMLCNLLALALLATTILTINNQALTMALLLLGATGVGAGFGFTIPALNTFAFDLFPGREDSAVTALHVFTGSGQMSVSLVLSAFVSGGIWWGAPSLIAGLVALMLLYQWQLPMELASEAATARDGAGTPSEVSARLPARAWAWGAVGLLYGFMAGTFGNWAPIYLEDAAGLDVGTAALGLTMFWGAVALGRIIFAALAVRVNVRILHLFAPFVVGVIFLLLPSLSGPTANLGALFAAGLALSFFFPYTISLASAEFPALTAAISGMLVAGLQLGSGLSANIVGLGVDSGLSLPTVFQLSTGYAAIAAVLVIYLRFSRLESSQTAMSDLHGSLPCQPLPCPQLERKDYATAEAA
ncbi:MAG: MFS transporter [Chloroflexi bacterium]|nr:MFS transporter [Chloroflexota bacterium]